MQAWFETEANGAIRYYSSQGKAVAGNTPQPCGFLAGAIQGFAVDSEVSSNNWKQKLSTDGKSLLQLNSARLGTSGQVVNKFLNSQTTPWIWSVLSLSADGTNIGPLTQGATTDSLSIFPQNAIYRNLSRFEIFPASLPGAFMVLGEVYSYPWQN